MGANIIAMYPSTSLFIAFGQLAIVILVLFSYPLQVHPCRNCLDKVFHPGHTSPPVKTLTDSVDDEDGEEADDEEADDEHANTEMSNTKHTILTSAIIASGFTIAYLVDDLQMGRYCVAYLEAPLTSGETVLSFVGSTGSTTISFILPGLFYWKV